MDVNDITLEALKVSRFVIARGIEQFDAAEATFYRNRLVPGIADLNHVTNVRVATTAESDTLLERVEIEYNGFPHRLN